MQQHIIIIFLLLFGPQLMAQEKARYTQSAKEIDAVMATVEAYNAGDWTKMEALYHPKAEVSVNGAKVGPKMAIAGHRNTAENASFYHLQLDKTDVERVVTDKGETWVNIWGNWSGVLKGQQDTLKIPVHFTYRFNDAGKVVKEYGLYDTKPLDDAMAAMSYGEDQLLHITEMKVKEGMQSEFEAAVKNYISAMDAAEVDLGWLTMVMDDGTVFTQNSIQSLRDVETLRAKEAAAAGSIDQEMLAKMGSAFNKTIEGEREYVVRRIAGMSYWPTGPEGLGGEDVGAVKMIAFTFSPEHRAEVVELTKKMRKLLEEIKTPLPYNFFIYTLGGPEFEFVVGEFGKDKADLEQRLAAEQKLLEASEEGPALLKRMGELLTVREEKYGKPSPELSRE